MNVCTDDPDLARETRLRLWAEHLEVDPETIAGLPANRVVDDWWRPIAAEQLRRREAGEPPTHHLLELPGSRVVPTGCSARCWGSSTTGEAGGTDDRTLKDESPAAAGDS